METKMITIPFDVELAKKIQAGEHPGEIVTRNGRKTRVLCFDAKHDFPIIGLVTKSNGEESLHIFRSDGNYYRDGREDKTDLVLQVPEWTQFKDGDILSSNDGVFIFHRCDEVYNNICYFHFGVTPLCPTDGFGTESYDGLKEYSYATEEEKQKIINALKASTASRAKEYLKRFFGIEDVKEKLMREVKSEGKPYDKVLVRCLESEKWQAAFYSHYDNGRSFPYVTTGSCSYRYCIPYNEKTKHLLGTTDNWEGEEWREV